jgi:hypothetical protein
VLYRLLDTNVSRLSRVCLLTPQKFDSKLYLYIAGINSHPNP